MLRKAIAAALTASLVACGATEVTAVKGAMVPAVGWYRYQATTRGNVVLTGALLVAYAGTDSLSGEILAADPQGKPYLEGHIVTKRGKDGTYVFQVPKSEQEPTGSTYTTRLYRTSSGYTCEFSDVRLGNTVTTVCEVIQT
jgi:hypothetical protein